MIYADSRARQLIHSISAYLYKHLQAVFVLTSVEQCYGPKLCQQCVCLCVCVYVCVLQFSRLRGFSPAVTSGKPVWLHGSQVCGPIITHIHTAHTARYQVMCLLYSMAARITGVWPRSVLTTRTTLLTPCTIHTIVWAKLTLLCVRACVRKCVCVCVCDPIITAHYPLTSRAVQPLQRSRCTH